MKPPADGDTYYQQCSVDEPAHDDPLTVESPSPATDLQTILPYSTSLWTNMYFAVGSVLALSIALGTAFYYYHEKWELSTCFYYACMVLNGNMFDTPTQENTDHEGEWFTLLFYIFGSSLMASAYGAFASVILENSRKLASEIRHEVHEERRKSVCMTAKSARDIFAEMEASALSSEASAAAAAVALSNALSSSSMYGSVEEGGRGDGKEGGKEGMGEGGGMGTGADERGHRFSLWLHSSLARKHSSRRGLGLGMGMGGLASPSQSPTSRPAPMLGAPGVYKQPTNTTPTTTTPTAATPTYTTPTPTATIHLYLEYLLIRMGWYDHRTKYLTLLALCFWTALGILYGTLYERWDVLYALRFAIATMAASGLPVPPCEVTAGYVGCQLGYRRAVFVGVYVLIGVPLFAFTLGQVRRASRRGRWVLVRLDLPLPTMSDLCQAQYSSFKPSLYWCC